MAQSAKHHVCRNGGIKLIETVAVFERKAETLTYTRCVIDKVIELSKEEYVQFSNHLLDEQDFIKENREFMYEETNGKNHCLLVLGEGLNDGVLVQAEGCSFARYAAVLPNARMLWNMEQHPTLKKHYENAISVYESYSEKTMQNHQDGHYRIDLDDIFSEVNSQYLTKSLLEDMMQENPDFETVELIDGELFITLAEHAQERNPAQPIRRLKSEEIEIMLAKHVLWLHDAGGEQADFTNCEIYDMDLESYRLDQAIFKNAVIRNSSLRCANVRGADFENAIFEVCDVSHIISEDANFKGTSFKICEMQDTVFKNCNLKDAFLFQVATRDCRMQNCCIENIKIRNQGSQRISMQECSRDEIEWEQENMDVGMSM